MNNQFFLIDTSLMTWLSKFPQQIMVCECGSVEHQIVITYDPEENLAYCRIHLARHGFLKRVKTAIRYIFGYKSKYGEWETFILGHSHVKQLQLLADLLGINDSKFKNTWKTIVKTQSQENH